MILRKINLHIISTSKFLYLTTFSFNKLFDNEWWNGISGISLLYVGFNNNSTIHDWSVILFVLRWIVRMESMSHITRNQERAWDRLWKWSRCGRKTIKKRRNKAWFSSRCGHAADFFVIEKSNAIDIPFRRDISCRRTFCQSFHCTETEDDYLWTEKI